MTVITINSPSQVIQLPLDDDLINALILEIEQPFESAVAVTVFWQQTNTRLLLIEPDDDLDNLSKSDPVLAFAIEYPEWIINLPQDHQLSLAVTTDDGGGCYLLCPTQLIKSSKD